MGLCLGFRSLNTGATVNHVLELGSVSIDHNFQFCSLWLSGKEKREYGACVRCCIL